MIEGFTKRPKTKHIEVTERYNLENLKDLSKIKDFSFLQDDDDEGNEEECKFDAIPSYIDKILKELKKQEYFKRTLEQKDVGRYYYIKKENYGVLYLKNAVRGFILKKGTVDLDIKNCHPTLLSQLIKEQDLISKELDEYIKNRDEVMKKYNFDKDTFLKMINNKNFKTDNQFLLKVHETIYKKFIPIMKNKYQEFYNECTLICNKKKKTNNIEGTFISRLLQEAEQDVMFYCIEFLNNNNIEYGCLIYDGIHIYEPIDSEIINDLCKYIYKKCEYNVKFSLKEFPKQDLVASVIKLNKKEEDEKTTYENDLVTLLFEKFKKMIKYYNETLYLKDEDYKWISSEKEVPNILIRWMLQIDNKINISKIEGVKKIFTARASRDFLDPYLKKKFDNSTKNKLCFLNGHLDIVTKEFVKWKDSSDNILTDLMIDYNYEPSGIIYRNEIYNRVLNPIFDNNKFLMEEFFMYCARALGMNKDKYWLSIDGERDSGKGVLSLLFHQSFGAYSFEFSSSNLTVRKNLEGEIRNTWAEPFVKYRLGFCNETNELNDEHKNIKLDGTKIKKIASGGDEIQIKLMRENTRSESIRASIVMLQNTLLPCSPNDAMINMLTFRFPCYFTDEPRDLEFSKFKKADNGLKQWIENEKNLRCAFVDIVISHYTNEPKYTLFKDLSKKIQEVEVDDNHDQRLLNLFQFTKNDKDFISTEKMKQILLNSGIPMASNKVKQRLETRGAVHGQFKINGIVRRGYRRIKLNEETEDNN